MICTLELMLRIARTASSSARQQLPNVRRIEGDNLAVIN